MPRFCPRERLFKITVLKSLSGGSKSDGEGRGECYTVLDIEKDALVLHLSGHFSDEGCARL
jgi:hypothetical protein